MHSEMRSEMPSDIGPDMSWGGSRMKPSNTAGGGGAATGARARWGHKYEKSPPMARKSQSWWWGDPLADPRDPRFYRPPGPGRALGPGPGPGPPGPGTWAPTPAPSPGPRPRARENKGGVSYTV